MATKRQRMAIVTVTGEPKLSMPQFLATLPAAAGTHTTSRLASDAECYLAYCYLCRTGLWDDLAPKVSACGTLYFMCTPSTTVMVAPPQAPAFQKHAKRRRDDRGAPAAAAAAPAATAPDAPGAAASPGDAVAAQCDAREAGGDSSLDGEAEEMEVDGDGASDGEDAGGGVAVHTCPSHAAVPAQTAGGGVLPTAEEAAAQRVATITVPVSISTSAPTPDRLHQLLALSDVEGGAPVSMALVDSDCTCIVSNIYRGFVPPPALDVVDGVADDDDDPPAPAAALDVGAVEAGIDEEQVDADAAQDE